MKQLRKERGLSVYKVAEISGLREQTIKNAERRGVSPTARTLRDILKALKIPATQAGKILYGADE